jgi:CDP-6-deoxy-D-xylo-4-hexulose-3-dehydrase
MTLTSDKLKDRKINRGDEILTVAAAFPTTVSPVLNYSAVPVFVDIDINTLNINVSQLYKGLSEKTKAIFVANTLGNPINLDAIKYFCDENNIWLILDDCDSLGSTYKEKHLDNYADISTHSFFPAHGLSCGQGGAVCTNNNQLNKIMNSMLRWGRKYNCKDCNGNCNNRFGRKTGSLPEAYDCKYIFEHLGFNFMATDLQASILCAQIDKLPIFIQKRKENWNKYYEGLKDLSNYFIFQTVEKKSDPCWFGFAITLRDNIKFKRIDLIKFLEDKKIESRLLFAGNILYQPCMKNLKKGIDYKVIRNMNNTDKVMKDTFFLGVYPGMKNEYIDYTVDSIRKFCKLKG